MKSVNRIENGPQSTSETDADEDDVVLIPAPEPPLVNLVSDEETEDDDEAKATPSNRQEIETFDLSSSDESDDDLIDLFGAENLLSGIISDNEEDKGDEGNEANGKRSEDEERDVVKKPNGVNVSNSSVVIDLCEPNTSDASSSETTDDITDEDVPLSKRIRKQKQKQIKASVPDDISDDEIPLSKRIRQQKEMKSSEADCIEHEPKESTEQKNDVTTSTAAPNWTAVDSNMSEECEPVQSSSHVVADSTTATNETTETPHSDKVIHLTQQQYRQLVSEKGNNILQDMQLQYDVSVRLEWRQNGKVLVVHGTESNQQNFCNVLQEYSESFEMPHNFVLHTQLPSDRDAIISYVRSQVAILDSAMCNVSDMAGLAQSLFNRIRRNGTTREKAKENMCLRHHLNMLLFGRYGFGQGKYHLNALQGCLRRIVNLQSEDVSLDLRARLNEHMEYIFSGVEHQNYQAMINEMRRYTSVPPLNLDRNLMGLDLNAWPSYFVHASQQGYIYNCPPPQY